jgi:hypothetical protein
MENESTGPTGPTGPTGEEWNVIASIQIVNEVGPTGPTGADVSSLFPSAASTSVDQNLVSLDELMSSHAVVLAKETSDRQRLSELTSPSREQYRPPLFQWAAMGFPHCFIIQSFDIAPPNICSDGVSRDPMAYLQYLFKPTTFDSVLDSIRSVMPGISVTFSFLGTSLRIHVSKP